MSWKKTLAAALVLAGLGVLYYLDAEHGKREIKEKMIAARLFDVAPESIERIRVEPVRAGGEGPEAEPFTLARQDGRWAIVEPIAAGIEPAAAGSIVERVRGETIVRQIDEPDRLSGYGLDPPRLVVHWWKDGAEQPAIRLGDPSPTRSMVFAQVEGRPQVYGLDSGVLYDLARKVNDLRDRRVLDFEPEAVRRIEIARGPETLVLARAEDGWRIEQPVAAPADQARVDSFLRSLKALRVQIFVEDSPAKPEIYDLEPPRFQLALLTGDDLARHELQLGGDTPSDGVFARRAGTPAVFSIYKDYLAEITPAAADLRDRTVLRFERDAVTGIEIRGRHGPIRLERTGEEWRLAAPEERPADQGVVNGLLSTLEYMTAEGFAELPELGGAPPDPAVEVTLAAAGEQALSWSLKLAPLPGAAAEAEAGDAPGALAWSDPGGPFFRVRPAEIERIDLAPFQLGNRLLLDFKREEARSITIESGGRRLELAGRGDEWRVKEPDNAGLDEKAIQDVLWALDYLELDRPAEDGALPAALGLEPPRWTITVSGAGGDQAVLLGGEAPEGFVAAAGGDRARIGLIQRSKVKELLDLPFFAGAAPPP